MKNFGRALKLALRYRFTLAGIVFCSLGVALLWGANLSAVYPLFEVVLQGKSMHQWVDEKIEKGEANSADIRREIAQLQQALPKVSVDQKKQQQNNINLQQSHLLAEQQALAAVRRLKPVIQRYAPDGPYMTLVYVVSFLLIGTLLKVTFLVGNMMLVQRLAQRAQLELRDRFFQRALQLELNAFGKSRSSELTSRVTSDIGSITSGISYLFGKLMREPLKMIVCVAGAAFISWRLLLFSMLICPLALYLTYLLAKSIKRANRRAMEEMAELFNRLSETFAGIQAVKAFTMERFERNRFLHTAQQLYRKTMKITLYDSLTRLNNELLGIGVICLAILAGGYLVLNRETHLLGIMITDKPLEIGHMMMFYAFLIGASDPARKLSDAVNVIQRGAAGAERVFEILDRRSEIIEPSKPLPIPQGECDIVFEHIDFHYTENQPVLHDVNLTIPAGQTLAIVGSNGCGKSTLVNLIPRFFDPIEGTVRLGDVDVRDVLLRDLRGAIGVVNQQPVLFNDTVMSNIRYGSLEATDEEVIAAARQAHAHRFIVDKLDQGYDTVIGERGGRLSGGQRQRIALARAILRDPTVILLDEATSQIDPESEQLIHRALEQFFVGRTAVMITHRLSTLDLADSIVVMDSGRIVDQGSHQQLIDRCELYRRLYQSKFGESA